MDIRTAEYNGNQWVEGAHHSVNEDLHKTLYTKLRMFSHCHFYSTRSDYMTFLIWDKCYISPIKESSIFVIKMYLVLQASGVCESQYGSHKTELCCGLPAILSHNGFSGAWFSMSSFRNKNCHSTIFRTSSFLQHNTKVQGGLQFMTNFFIQRMGQIIIFNCVGVLISYV